MRTPQEYKKNLQNGIITEEMLSDALYSANKRAKNWRDKKREYKAWQRESYYRYDKYGDVNKAEANEHQMYKRKEELLSLVDPLCIHKEFAGYETIRIYDYQSGYEDLYFDAYFHRQITWSNSYYDYEKDKAVEFFDKTDLSKPKFRYYIYYKVGDRTFHSPIDEKDLKEYDLPVLYISTLQTAGNDITDLLSVQFLDQMIAKISEKEASYTGGKPDFDWDRARQSSDRIQAEVAQGSDKAYGSAKVLIHLARKQILKKMSEENEPYEITDADKESIHDYCMSILDKKYNKTKAQAKRRHMTTTECWHDPQVNGSKFEVNDVSDIRINDEVWQKLDEIGDAMITRQRFTDILDECGCLGPLKKTQAKQRAKEAYCKKIWPDMLEQYKKEKLGEEENYG